ncbi:MAG TPA: hypothetical protein VFY34_07355 [Pyrinomonadaceae bacterium]|nr:hypothetical protein [Pyrinomonadaceae bacterium]
MKFIDFNHPEGGRLLVNIDHITSAHYRPGEGDLKTRLSLDLDERQNDVVLFGAEADRAWERLRTLLGET